MATPKTAIPAARLKLIAQTVDELGALEQRVLPYKADLARIEILRKALRVQYDDAPASETHEAKGEYFVATLGPRAYLRSINPAKLIKAIGLKVYATFATCTLAALEANVDAVIVAGVVTSDYTGPRPIKTFERAV